MRLTITEECRYVRTPDNRFWVTFGTDYALWSRYLEAFDEVRVVARARDVAEIPPNALRVDGDRVTVAPIPYYQGPRQYVQQMPRIDRAVRRIAADAEAVLLRTPSTIATHMHRHITRRGLPYAMEVIGDPYAVFAPGVVEHPLRPFLRAWTTRNLKRQCESAVAVSYETSRTLQARYPTRPGALSTGISSVNLPPAAYVQEPRTHRPPSGSVTLMSVGSLEQLYKGIDTLIEAISLLGPSTPAVRHVHVGPGRYQPALEELATRLGVRDRVTFAGWIPTVEALRHRLDSADLFVMPSRTEGLPRALIEAMARALPAIGSTAGGIPELLPPEMLFTAGDADDLARVLRRTLADREGMVAASRRNLAVAREFAEDRLVPRRTEFYRAARGLMSGRPRLPQPAAPAAESVRHENRPA
ncbi:glycosyltransferase family 4 protein [Micromonospora aurantiaca]|uniref:glycosyltransferase family 4 protein n=1 Tax=Micromonospora aurantiaca (nom. illeg.) TaxID=47850 RepID=UPI0033D66CCA